MRVIRPGAAIGIALIASMAFGAADAPSVEVETMALRQQELRDMITVYGTVAASEESMIAISFPHSGQIAALPVRAGEQVRTGDALVTITADPAALQSYQNAVAGMNFAKQELARQQTLRAQRLATNAQVAAAEKAVADASVALETERKLGNDQDTKTATAPFDGYVAQLTAAPGDRLQPNVAIMKLARTDHGLRVTAGLKPDDAARVAPGMTAEISPIMSRAAQPMAGTVRQISGTVNPATRLIDAWIDVTRSAGLVPGTSVAVAIVLSKHRGWVVPRNAVLRDDQGSYIFQVADDRARRVDVQTGIETDQVTEISGNFDSSLVVVVAGNYELRDGMAVRPAAPARR
ncbi:MAG TPA: efflux RND transporter periplasmic adaptor subunit [Xanthobacteraceae bacterium]